MDSYRLDYLSSHYVDELDMQVAALEIRARRCFQQERNLYRHSIGIATTKLQQYCLGLVLSHRGPNGAIHALVEEAAMSSGLPVDLWAMHEVKRVWDEIVKLQRRLASTKNIRMPLTPRFISGPSTQSQMRAAHPSSTAGEAL